MFTTCTYKQLGTLRPVTKTEADDQKVIQDIISKCTLILNIFNRRNHSSSGHHKIYALFLPLEVQGTFYKNLKPDCTHLLILSTPKEVR